MGSEQSTPVQYIHGQHAQVATPVEALTEQVPRPEQLPVTVPPVVDSVWPGQATHFWSVGLTVQPALHEVQVESVGLVHTRPVEAQLATGVHAMQVPVVASLYWPCEQPGTEQSAPSHSEEEQVLVDGR